MSRTLLEHLARLCVFSRATFGPGERTKGVTDHIMKELDEVDKAGSAGERAVEWTDVAILGLDGLLRACRARLAENYPAMQHDGFGEPAFVGSEPTNDAVAELAVKLLTRKMAKNELRSWPDWRTADTDKAIEHARGAHD